MDLFTAACDNFGLVINTQHGESSDHASTATRRCLRRTPNKREQRPIASCGQPQLSGQHPLPQHQDRRLSGPPDLQSQSSLRTSAQHSLESLQSPPQHQTEAVQSSYPADAAMWSGDLNSVQEAGAKTQSFPPQLSSSEAEKAGPDAEHGCNGADGNPQRPRHTEATANALERPPPVDGRTATQTAPQWRCRHGLPPTRSSTVLQGYTEDLPEASADKLGQLG
ncbi:hypothetical protein SprV_0802576300 [Sparganum proliferum]